MADLKLVEINDLGKIVAVSSPNISPDGSRVVFVHTVMDMKEDEYINSLWMADLAKNKATQYTSSRGKDKNPQWSPDGTQILFTSTQPTKEDEEKKKPQLYIIDTSGGEARQVTNLDTGIESPKWSPNGKTVLFLSNVREKEPESDVKVITRLKYKFNVPGFFDGKRKHLFTVRASGDKLKQVTKGEYDVNSPEWINTRKIAFISNLNQDADHTGKSLIYTIETKGGDPKQVSPEPKSINALKPAPNGKTIAYTGHNYHKGSGSNSDIWTIPVEGRDPVNLTKEFDQDLGTKLSCDVKVSSPNVNPTWSNDGKYIYFTSTYDGVASLYKIKANGGKVEKIIGEIDHSVESFSIAEDGTIAYTVLDTVKPIELWKLKEGKTKQVTNLNKNYLKKTDVRPHEHFTFESNAGHTVEGWIIKPPNFDPSTKYPLILHIHGGPRGAYGNAMNHEFQVLAAQGWAVIYTNPFGSGGYYEDFQAGLPGHYFEQDYDDLMKAVDVVIERNDWVDKDKLGVTGGSYGGVMSNWIITHTERFKAAVTLRSITNWVTFFGVSDIGWTFGQREIGGVPWEMEEEFMAKSPIRYVANVTTPTMIIHSENDYRCPMEQAEQLFIALKYRGIDTEFIRFPNETHELSRSGKPKHRTERLEHIVRWFKKYLS